MFEKMIVSSAGRSERRITRYLVGAFLLYGLVLAAALAISVALADPHLAAPASGAKLLAVAPAPRISGQAGQPAGPRQQSSTSDLRYIPPLRDLLNRSAAPPVVPTQPPNPRNLFENDTVFNPFGGGNGGGPGGGPGEGSQALIVALPGSDVPAPKPPRPAADRQERRAPVRVSGPILQGKAIERRIPEYPPLARPIRLEGQVVVEVVISVDGRVESARAVSGHPLLINAAVEAARWWRFQPTTIGDVPVRVTGVLTFVFKFN